MFHTEYTDTNCVKHWKIYLSKCTNCGKRKLETDCPKKDGYFDHSGIEILMFFWEDRNIAPPKPKNNSSSNNETSKKTKKNQYILKR